MTTPAAPTGASLQLRAVPTNSELDAKRGLIRIAASVLDALGAKPYSVAKLTGAKTTAALVAQSSDHQDPGSVLVDELILGNLGVAAGAAVTVEIVPSLAADRVVLSGPPQVTSLLTPPTARLALLGKVVSTGDAVSLLQQDAALPEGASPDLLTQGRAQMQALFGTAWQGVVLTVEASPSVPSVVTMTTELAWAQPTPPAPSPTSGAAVAVSTVFPAAATSTAAAPPATGGVDLPGAESQAKSLRELLDIGLNNPALLQKLGSAPSLGVMLSGPSGVGKATLVRAVATALNLTVRIVWCPQLASLTPDDAAAQIEAIRKAALDGSGAREVVVFDEVEDIAPMDGNAPLAADLIAAVKDVVAAGRAVIAMSAVPTVSARTSWRPACCRIGSRWGCRTRRRAGR
ncbi:MAG TPA: AAA family ATPase [Mycobacteriales bacterium]|nr:AAA family ATPase [Mycobacteriales bacterium]